MVSIMPATVQLFSPIEHVMLKQLGERLVLARKARGLSASALASELGVSRNTLKAAERGKASVTIGTYVRILGVLGLLQDLALVADGVASRATDPLTCRHAELESQVTSGQRDARSLVAVPASMARGAKVVFPTNAFGEAQPW